MRNMAGIKALTAGAVTLSTAAGAQVFTQPAETVTPVLYSSMHDSGPENIQSAVYDNFTLGSGATLTQLDFTGGYYGTGAAGTTTAFEIAFYADNSGAPGSLLWSSTIAGDGGESCSAVYGLALCTYSLAIDFAASAGTQYWLSIVSDSTAFPQWGWDIATTGDGSSYQEYHSDSYNQDLSNTGVDFAFSLFAGTGVPEPATWAMMLVGFGAIGASMRRKSRNGLALQHA